MSHTTPTAQEALYWLTHARLLAVQAEAVHDLTVKAFDFLEGAEKYGKPAEREKALGILRALAEPLGSEFDLAGPLDPDFDRDVDVDLERIGDAS